MGTTEDRPPVTLLPQRTSASRKVRDPYADLLRDTRGLRREQAAARDAWFAGLGWERKEETLFELEMLMKGLVCFANPRNHPGPPRKISAVAMNFRSELLVARQTLLRIVSLSKQLLGTKDRAYIFTRYLETVLPEDNQRARLNRDAPIQESPEDSLLHLRHGLTMVGEVMDGVLRLEHVPYRLFHSLLVMAQREIQRNQFFNPLIALEFRPEFDRIRSPEALETIQSVENDQAHRVVALAYLACYRMLHYVQLLLTTSQDPASVRRVYVLLAVLRSDARAIIHYLRTRAAQLLADGFERDLLRVPAREVHSRFDQLVRDSQALANLRATLEGVASSLRVEMRAIFDVRVPSPQEGADAADLARAVLGSMASLRDALQSAIARVTFVLRGEIDPAKLFDDVDARRIVAERLRRDVWMFAQVMRAFVAKARATPDSPDQWVSHSSFQYVQEFLRYFRAMGYQLLRTADYPHFDRFLSAVEGLHDADFLEPARMQTAIRECEQFFTFLQESFDRISQRPELRTVPFDKRGAAEHLKLYLGLS